MRSLLLLGFVFLPALAVAGPACERLTDLERPDLETFAFDRAPDPWAGLPAGARYRLGEIAVVRQNVFERTENWLHRLANRYNVRTRENVILSILPVTSGEVVSERALEEAERILRGKVYLYDARVIPRRLCGEVLDVYLVTRDVWTLEPRLDLSRSGGENDVGFGIGDTNVLGSGKEVALGFEKDADRRGMNLYYRDPNIGDSRWAGEALIVDNDDGERLAASVAYPFFSLDTRRAFAFSVDHFSREEGLYFLSEEAWEYRADTRNVRTWAGWSPGRGDSAFVNRLMLGYAYENYEFDFPAEFRTAFPGAGSPDRDYAYPFIAFERIEDDFQTRTNLDRVQLIEDIALGSRLYLELGFAGSSAPAGDHLVARFAFSDAAWLARRQLLRFSAGLSGYYDLDDHASENLVADLTAAYRLQHSEQWSLLVQGSAAVARNPTLDQQLLIGGDFGLRGYPNRYQTGDRRFLLTVEERYYSNIYPLRMFRLGAAAFLDVGRAWYQGDEPDWVPSDRDGAEFDVLANLGVGLRLESTRTRVDRIIHLDVSFPLRQGPDVRGVEVTLSAKRSL
ncbi:MAG: hypothetical protein ACODAC_07325 [Pseudomonadota bacterium]